MPKDSNDQIIGGVNLGGLTDYLFVFTNGEQDANWQGATKGFVGDVAVDGLQASERTSGGVPFSGTIYTNDSTADAWQGIVGQNLGTSTLSTGETELIGSLEADLEASFDQIDALAASSGFESVDASELDGLNTQNGIAETFVINVTSGFSIDYTIDITGDADDVFILRWDEDANPDNGYQGTVKFQSGGGINPLGDLSPSNFINVAGDINASGGGSTPSGLVDDVESLDGVSGGGFFTGYWLTTGDSVSGDTQSLSNAIFVGGWYTSSDKFSLTSGTSGVYVAPTTPSDPVDPPEEPDDCINILENTSPVIADLDCGDGANPDVGTDICAVTHKDMNGFGEDTDKPTSYTLTLGDELTADINSTQGDKLEVSAVMAEDNSGSYLIRVSGDSDPSKTDKLFFEGDVDFGDSFTASEDTFGNSFGSETFVHILSSDGSTVLQTINFHTSCSAPLVIGDQYGSVSLEGAALVGKDTGTVYTVGGTSAPGDEGVTYEIKDGPGADLFTVNADGEVSFQEAPDFEDPKGLLDADGNPTNNYEVTVICTKDDGTVEEKVFEVCVEDDCINILENTSPVIADLDCGDGANPDVGTDICAVTHKDMNGFGEDTDKPTSYTLTLGDELTADINSTQGDKLEVSAVMAEDNSGSYLIRVSGDSDPSKTDKLFFEGDVDFGDSFTASEDTFGNSFGSETFVHILSSDGSTVLQTINFHTSCSAPLVIGDQYGSVSLEGAALVGKDTGTVYTVGGTSAPGDEGVTYEIKDGPGADLFTVNADGEVSFQEAPDFEDPKGLLDADGNPTNNYEVTVICTKDDGTVEEKVFEVCVEDQDCINIVENTPPADVGVIADLDCEDDEPENPDLGKDICAVTDKNENGFGEDTEKPSSYVLTLGDELTSEINSSQGDKLEVSAVMAEDNSGSYLIRVSGDSDPSKTDKLFFEGDVDFGDSFTASEDTFGNSFGSETFVHILSSDGSTVLQTINFHTSCSAPLVIGDQYGSITLDGAALVGKDTGTIYTVGGTGTPREVVYEITGGDGFDKTTGTSPFFNVDPETGEVTLAFTPDFENPLDDNGDNNYFVEVTGYFINEDGTRDVCEVKPIEICIEDVPEVGSLSGRYFCDTNDNDVDDGQSVDPGVEGVLVRLFLGGTPGRIATTFTDENGEYSFEGLAPGNYRVVFLDPDDVLVGKQLVDPNAGDDDTVDSDAIGDTNRSVIRNIEVVAGEDTPDNDAGAEYTASLGDYVFLDADADGIQDVGEAGITGVEVTLTGGGADGVIGTGGDDTTTTATTDVDGLYAFTGLNPGEEYQVTFDKPAGLEVSPKDQGSDDTVDSDGLVSEIVTLESGENNTTIDQGFYELASLGDYVWEDKDGDGIQDGDEPGVEGVTVELKDKDGTVIASTTTDSNGGYKFSGLIPGTYSVLFTAPTGFAFTTPNEGGDDTVDSDADPVTGMTQQVTLTSGEFNGTLDAGLVQSASLGDYVFLDADADGIQDVGEAGITGVEVTLTGGGADGVIGTGGDDTTTTATTDVDGLYAFTGLNPGEEYQVTFDKPAGLEVSPKDQGSDDTVDSDGLVSEIVTLESGENNTTIDQGFYELASLGDYVWEDKDGDGIQDGDEPGVEGVTVELKDKDGTVIASTTTDSNGGYKFSGLIPGTYSVLFTAPTGFAFTTPNEGGDDTVDSDADPVTGMTQQVTLTSGEFNGTLDAGLVQSASLGDYVFLDADADGIQDVGEAGITGVEVTLTGGGADGVIGTGGDDTTTTATTDVDGLYAFTGLNPGEEYQVTFDKPAGLEVSPKDQGSDDTVDSDGLVSEIVTLASGENNTTIDQGFYELASLGDYVWEDKDGDGIQDGDEPGVEGVTVELKDKDGTVIASTTTDSNGGYKFSGLIPGTYSVLFTAPAGFAFTTPNEGGDDTVDSDADPVTGMTQQVTLTSGEFNGTLDAGLVQSASLGDYVFRDKDADGIQDAGEAGIAGVTVTLTGGGADGVIGTGGDDTTTTTTTDTDGLYAFTGLNPGEEYQVTFDKPAGLEVSPKDQGSDDTVDSDGLVSEIVTLASGENNTTIDQGFYELASLGDYVWEDKDGDGIQDGDEPGVEGVTVELKDKDGTVIASTTTDSNGGYKFSGLIPGTYSVLFTAPAGFAFTTPNEGGDDTVDSDADPVTGMTQQVTLTSGEFNGTLDAGLVQSASLGDYVFRDKDADGIQDAGEAGIAGVTVTLTGGGADGVIGTGGDDTTTTTTTDTDGLYAFTGLNPGEEYQVTFDKPAGLEVSPKDQGSDDTVDSDGLVSEIVTLASGENNTTIDQGFYELASLGDYVWEDKDGDGIQDGDEPGVEGVTVELKDKDGTVIASTTTDSNGGYKFSGLIPGTYSVLFTAPAGFAFTTPNEGGDGTVDSDADPVTGMTQQVTLTSGEFNGTLDAGLVQSASLGDYVFRDKDADGIQDAGEAGIAGVTVTLTGGGADGVIGTGGDDTTTTTTTDTDGLYAFTGLNPGEEYQVTFDKPAGLEVSPKDQGSDDTVDSDGLVSEIVTLASGENNTTIDQGFYELASLGDYVWEDKDGDGIQDGDEPGVEGVTVELKDKDGTVIASTTTDSNGGYKFSGLIPGTYSVLFTAPAGFAFTTPNEGGDGTVDSDADPVTGMTQQVTLTSGEFNGTLDAGLVRPIPEPDTGKGCADEPIKVENVLSNDFDPSGTGLTVTEINGQSIQDGETIMVDPDGVGGRGPVQVTLHGDTFIFNGEATYTDLDIGEEETALFTYTVEDGNGGSATANMTVTFCGTANTIESLFASLPTTGSYQIRDDNLEPPVGTEAYDIRISGTGDARFDGVIFDKAYCLSLLDPASTAEEFANAPVLSGDILDGNDGSVFGANQVSFANGENAADNLDLINWLIAQDFEGANTNAVDGQFTGWEVQRAIWELTDQFDTDYLSAIDPAYGDNADVDFLVNAAINPANEGFMAGPGGIATFIVDPNPTTAENAQPFIAAFNFDDFDCIC